MKVFYKTRQFKLAAIIISALLLLSAGLTFGLVFGRKNDKSFTNDYGDAVQINELWTGSSFSGTNLQKLFDTIYGQPNSGFGLLYKMAIEGRADDAAICLKEGTTAETMRQNNGGKEIIVRLGGLDWSPTYLSKDKQGNTILTLWMTSSIQEAFDGLGEEPPYSGSPVFTIEDDGSTNMQSVWSSVAGKKVGKPYPLNMYGASLIRVITLNAGGKYTQYGDDLYDFSQDPNSVFAKFTMSNVQGNLTKYIVAPEQLQWQEYGQNVEDQFGNSLGSRANENWSDQIPDTGEYKGTTYHFSSYNNVSSNYAGNTYNSVWKKDKLWLPSITEVGYKSSYGAGIWCTSLSQRKNFKDISWLRSGRSGHVGNPNNDDYIDAYYLDDSGEVQNTDTHSINWLGGVRPALHLNLTAAAESQGLISSTITLDQQGGSGGLSNVTVFLGDNLPKLSSLPTKAGYNFDGYYTSQNGQGTKYYNADGTGAIVCPSNPPATLYANWKLNSSSITLDRQGGEGGSSSVDVIWGESLPKITPPTRSGYNFDGYYSSSNGEGTRYYNADGTGAIVCPSNPPTTLYANWIQNSSTITLDRQGGTGGSSSVDVIWGKSLPTITPPTRAGYTFEGFYTSQNGGGTKYYNADGTGVRVCPSNPPTTLYANWRWVRADSWSGYGTNSSPYLIQTAADLELLSKNSSVGANYSGVYFKQTANINMASSTWKPIGSLATNFKGIYDGQNYQISSIRGPSSMYSGLFGYTSDATLKNIKVSGTISTSSQYVGGIVGYAASTNITNCSSSVDVSGQDYVGGIVGNASNSIIRQCVNFGTVYQNRSGSNTDLKYVGGIAGACDSSIMFCMNYGDITGYKVGGIVGLSSGQIQNCIQKSYIISPYSSTKNYIGLFAGETTSSLSIVSCAAYGEVHTSYSSQNLGLGMIGLNSSKYPPTLRACSFVGDLYNITYSSFFNANLFYGESNSDIKPTVTACYVYGKERSNAQEIKQYTYYSNFSQFYGIVKTMNDGLPMQTSLYRIAAAAHSTSSEITAAFNSNGFYRSSL